jgi:hypothetical protein
MNSPLSIEHSVYLQRRSRGRKELRLGLALRPSTPGRVPRVARLMALALRFEEMVRTRAVASYAELATLGHVTRARISQIMSLLHLSPDIQEQVLFLPQTERGRDPIHLAHLRSIAAVPDWRQQRKLWQALQSAVALAPGVPGAQQSAPRRLRSFGGKKT